MGNSEEFEDELSRMRERKSRGRSRSQAKTQKKTDETLGGAERLSADGQRKKTRKPKKTKKRMALRILIIILEVLVLLGIAGYVYVTSKFNQVQRVEDWKPEDIVNIELTPEQKEVMKGYKTIAVFGVDARDNKQLEKGTHSDVIMICNINMDTGEIQLVSVFRDTYLNINDKNTYRKINQAYFEGGPKQAVKALNKNLDLNIEDYVTFNWKAVIDGINILGGVDIEINSRELRYLNAFITETVKATGIGSHQISKTGVIHMDGVQAVAYGRLRLMDSDYVRTERQKIVVKAAFEKAKKASILKLNELTGVMLSETSTSLDWGDIVPLVENISKLYLGDSLGFPMARGEMRLNGGDYVVPQTLESNVIELHKTLFESENYAPTATLKKISDHIASISGFTKPGKNAGVVVIGGGSSGNSGSSTSPTKEKTEKTTEETKKSTEADDEENLNESENDDGENSESRSPEQATDENGKPIVSESASKDGSSSHSSGSESGDEDGEPVGPNGPNGPNNPSRNPSTSNEDLIYEEPGGAVKPSESWNGGSGPSLDGLTPGGNTNESNSEVIITDKSPSEASGSTTAAQNPTKDSTKDTTKGETDGGESLRPSGSSPEPGKPTSGNDTQIIVGEEKPTEPKENAGGSKSESNSNSNSNSNSSPLNPDSPMGEGNSPDIIYPGSIN